MSFNSNRYFSGEENLTFQSNFQNKSILKKAALMYDFDIENDFSEFEKSAIEILKAKAYQRIDGKYVLEEEFRNNVIINEIGVNNISNEIEKNNIKTDFANFLRKSIQNPQTNYQNLNTTELFYSSKITDILPNQFNSKTINSELQLRQFFIPFERITEKFAGRRNELEKISEYVDWLPKKGFGNIVSSVFRNVIGWHEKPPMLIQGIGGIGKSTLVAQFILEQNRNRKGKTLPFIFIDFDLPGFTLKEPLNILIESFRQLSILYPNSNFVFDKVSNKVSNLIYSKSNNEFEQGNFSKHQSSNSATRGLIYNSIEDIIHEYNFDLKNINTPILVVFDSFEEMQYRATRDELYSFFTFIREIANKIPRLRPIFVGRSEISERVGDFDFEIVELKEFDKESAIALLQKYGVEDTKKCQKIFENLGGNPLVLQLTADLIKKEPESINDFNKIKGTKQEYLIKRILEHIHNADVRKIAVPGMLIRSINPEIIKEVLAGPCQLGEIDEKKSNIIFEELRKEAALISRISRDNEIAFRQDLRMVCERMIWDKYPKEATSIQINIINYYKNRKNENEANLAEYYYHLLKRGELPKELDKNTYEKIRKYMEVSVKEFPEKSQLFISQILSSKSDQNIVDKSSIVEFENYYLPQIKNGLSKELTFLKQIYDEINIRQDRSNDPNSEFPIFEALLCQRLNKLDESNQIIQKAIKKLESNDLILLSLLNIWVQNLEYNNQYFEGFEVCEKYLETFYNKIRESYLFKGALQEKIFNLFYNRLLFRTEKKYLTENLKILNFPDNFESSIINDFKYTNWEYLLKNYNSEISFSPGTLFNTVQNKFIIRIKNINELEQYCHKILGVFLKDISLTGEFEIVLKDFIYVLEVEEKLDGILVNFNQKLWF